MGRFQYWCLSALRRYSVRSRIVLATSCHTKTPMLPRKPSRRHWQLIEGQGFATFALNSQYFSTFQSVLFFSSFFLHRRCMLSFCVCDFPLTVLQLSKKLQHAPPQEFATEKSSRILHPECGSVSSLSLSVSVYLYSIRSNALCLDRVFFPYISSWPQLPLYH